MDPISKDKLRLDQDMVDWKAAVLKGSQDVGELLDSKFEDIDSQFVEMDSWMATLVNRNKKRQAA